MGNREQGLGTRRRRPHAEDAEAQRKREKNSFLFSLLL
jgi:hypothetical protein